MSKWKIEFFILPSFGAPQWMNGAPRIRLYRQCHGPALAILLRFSQQCFTVQMDNDPKHTAKATQVLLKAQKKAELVTWPQPNWACFSLTEDKTEGRKTHKQTRTQVGCSKGLAKHLKAGNSPFGGFQASGSHWLQRIFIQVLQIILIFIIMWVCPIIFEPLKMEELCIRMAVIPKWLMQCFLNHLN